MYTADIQPRRTSLADRYRVLLEIGRTLTGTLGKEDLFRRVYRETSRVLDASGFYISVYDPADDLATVVFYADRGVERHVEVSYRGSDSEVIRTGKASTFGVDEGVESLLVLGEDSSEITRSAVSAPMRFKGKVTGAISAQSYRRGCYSSEDVEMLQAIADMAAVAVENARRVEELQARRREAERIEEIGRAVVASLEPGRVLGKVVDAALELLGCDSAAVWFLDDDCRVRVEASQGTEPIEVGFSFQVDRESWKRFMEVRKPLLIPDMESTPLLPRSVTKRASARSALVVPLVVEDEVVGALTVGSRELRAFADDVQILERLASQASVALENARLHAHIQALSLTDPLTGLPNRRHLDIHLEREVAAAMRGRNLSVVIFDLDNFKKYNDTLGHQAGDEILQAFARILEDESRSMNLVARFGGDEFVSVMADTSLEGVQVHAERVEKRVLTDPLMEPHGITVSYGIASYRESMESSRDLFLAADEDLYRIKESRVGSRRFDRGRAGAGRPAPDPSESSVSAADLPGTPEASGGELSAER